MSGLLKWIILSACDNDSIQSKTFFHACLFFLRNFMFVLRGDFVNFKTLQFRFTIQVEGVCSLEICIKVHLVPQEKQRKCNERLERMEI